MTVRPLSARATAALLLAAILPTGCGRSGPAPPEITTYQCPGGRSYVVTVRPGSDRVAVEVAGQRLLLARGEGDAAGAYTNGPVTWAGPEGGLTGAPGGPYTGCTAGETVKGGGPPVPVE
ncbi:MAG: hypothetical protein AB7O45_04795 [Alphaproteobacteria bacterium]